MSHFYITEIFVDETRRPRRRVHTVEPTKYTDIISWDAFRNGKRWRASKLDRKHLHDRCCWGPEGLFHVQWNDEFEMSFNGAIRAYTRCGNLDKYMEEDFGIAATKIEELPIIHHNSIWDFYQMIGFDHKLRGYRDQNGKPLVYCTITNARNQPSAVARQKETQT